VFVCTCVPCNALRWYADAQAHSFTSLFLAVSCRMRLEVSCLIHLSCVCHVSFICHVSVCVPWRSSCASWWYGSLASSCVDSWIWLIDIIVCCDSFMIHLLIDDSLMTHWWPIDDSLMTRWWRVSCLVNIAHWCEFVRHTAPHSRICKRIDVCTCICVYHISSTFIFSLMIYWYLASWLVNIAH